jgi:hypothetical protein
MKYQMNTDRFPIFADETTRGAGCDHRLVLAGRTIRQTGNPVNPFDDAS